MNGARAVGRALDEVRNRFALRRATRVGDKVRVFGWPSVVCDGELAIGSGVLLVSTPAPIHLVVAAGASLVIGDGSVIESGVTVRARRRVVIGNCARLGPGCIVDDEGSDQGITIAGEAWIEEGAVLLGGTVVSARSHVPRGAVVAAGQAAEADSPRPSASDAEPELDERVRKTLMRVVPGARQASPDEDLSRLKGWDSLCALRAVVALEKEFGVVLQHDLLAVRPRIASLSRVIAATGSREDARG